MARRGPKAKSQIFSVFGQIEAVVAEEMVKEGKFNRIEAADIPPTASVNDAGQRARFAVVVPNDHLSEFEDRIARLRA